MHLFQIFVSNREIILAPKYLLVVFEYVLVTEGHVVDNEVVLVTIEEAGILASTDITVGGYTSCPDGLIYAGRAV